MNRKRKELETGDIPSNKMNDTLFQKRWMATMCWGPTARRFVIQENESFMVGVSCRSEIDVDRVLRTTMRSLSFNSLIPHQPEQIIHGSRLVVVVPFLGYP